MRILKGNIVISSFTSSYDVTLGDNYYIEEHPSNIMLNSSSSLFNPYCEADVKKVHI